MYKIYEIDICFQEYATHYCLVGANDFEDMKAHITSIFKKQLSKRQIKEILDSKEGVPFSRIREMKNAYTDKPYEILDSFAYYE